MGSQEARPETMDRLDKIVIVAAFAITMLIGMYIGVKLEEPFSDCKNYVYMPCPKQDPVAWYTLTDDETLECKVDNAVIHKTVDTLW